MPMEEHVAEDGTTYLVGTDEELEDLMERAKVNDAQRISFRSAPEAGKRLLAYALDRPKIRNPAAFAYARLREEHEHPERGATVLSEKVAVPAPPLAIEDLESGLAFARRFGAPADVIAGIEAELQAARSAG